MTTLTMDNSRRKNPAAAAEAMPSSAEDWIARLGSPRRSYDDWQRFVAWYAMDFSNARAFAWVSFIHDRAAETRYVAAVARAASAAMKRMRTPGS